MKQKLTIVAALMLAMFIPSAVMAQEGNKVVKDPDHSQWVIKASMNSGMQGAKAKYWIDSVSAKGIFFKQENSYEGDYNSLTEKVSFTFKDSYTIPEEKINDGLILWTQNSKGKWVQDAEKTENKLKVDSTKILTVVLVLDCSGSMSEGGSDNFNKMKSCALSFVDTLWRYSRSGNIHVGVIGFNTTVYADNHTLTPTPLNAGNYSVIREHIRNLVSVEGAGTALYYSIDHALQLLKDDYNACLDKKLYNGSALVSFTDGKDNLSKDTRKGITNLKGYLKYMQDTFCKGDVIIGGKPVFKRLIGFRGQNVDLDEWNSMVEDVQSVFCKDNAFIPITRIDELNTEFSKIAKQLIQSNMSLVCQVPSAITGPVAWTIPEYERVRERKPNKTWMGIGLEAGLEHYRARSYYNNQYHFERYKFSPYFGLRVDATWPLYKRISLGGTLALPFAFEEIYDFEFMDFGVKFGPLVRVNSLKGSLLAGTGVKLWTLNSDLNIVSLYVTCGWKFKSPWFINANWYFVFRKGDYGLSLGVGYSILGK